MSSSTVRAAAAKHLSASFQSISADQQNLVRISREMMGPLAASLLPQMGITAGTSSPVAVLDSACGGGVFTQEVQATLSREVLEKSSFLCADFAAGNIDLVRKRVQAEDWVNVEARVLDAMKTELPADSFTHTALTLGLHLIPEPDVVVKDCMRVLKPEGMFGATTFHRDNGLMFWFPDFKSSFDSFPFEAPLPERIPMQTHESGHWYDANWVEGHLENLGLKNVQVKVLPGSHHLESAADFVATFGMMIQWVMNAWWSEETRAAHPVEEVKELMAKHLDEKHGGKGWDVNWMVISMTGQNQ